MAYLWHAVDKAGEVLESYGTKTRYKLNRAEFAGGSNFSEGGAYMSKTTNKFAPAVREPAVRMVVDHEPSSNASTIRHHLGLWSAQPISDRFPSGPRHVSAFMGSGMSGDDDEDLFGGAPGS